MQCRTRILRCHWISAGRKEVRVHLLSGKALVLINALLFSRSSVTSFPPFPPLSRSLSTDGKDFRAVFPTLTLPFLALLCSPSRILPLVVNFHFISISLLLPEGRPRFFFFSVLGRNSPSYPEMDTKGGKQVGARLGAEVRVSWLLPSEQLQLDGQGALTHLRAHLMAWGWSSA